MGFEVIDRMQSNISTRRQVVRTGAKLAYAVPLVAASFRLTSGSTVAAVSIPCVNGTCDAPVLCGGSDTCVCRAVDGGIPCLQDVFCGDTDSCTSSAQCPGGYCIPTTTNCCEDGFGYCVYPCGTGPGIKSADVSAAEGRRSILGQLG